jgi:hypothetical protein
VVNVGSPAAPDYRLSLESATLGANTIDLTDGSGNHLIASSTAGSLASYSIDGSTAVSSDSRNITIAPGVTATLGNQNVTGQPTSISVANSPTAVINAFNSFAQAYSAAVNTLAQHHGQNGGVLEGDSLISSLTTVLQQLGNYTAGTPETALASYGISLDQSGRMSVDGAAFTTAANANFSGLIKMLGSSTTGGFLQTAVNLLKGVEDPSTGSVKQAESSMAAEIAAQQTKISNAQANLTAIEQNLQKRISSADATIASLESQVSYVSGLFAASLGGSTSNSSFGATGGNVTPTQL